MPAQNVFGLDIGSSITKLIQLTKQGPSYELITASSISSPSRAILSEALEDQESLAEVIKRLFEEAKPTTKNVNLSLPESQIFTRVVEMPYLTDAELSSALKWEAEQYVPVPLNEVQIDWQVLSTPPQGSEKGGKMEILLVAAPKILIEKYLNIMRLSGLEPLALETETIALTRVFTQTQGSSPTTLIISLGASSTDICIVHQGKLTFTRSITTGGLALSRAIGQDLGFEIAQAEEYKKTYGLDASQLEGKVMQSIKPVFDMVVNEIRRALAYYMGRRPNDPIKRVVLTGGTAKMPGIVIYLANALGIEVQLGNTWEKVKLPNNLKAKLESEALEYGTVVGLAMREDYG